MIISSDRLVVEIAEPGVFPANTSRFDWCGFITSVKLDGRYEFCASEPTNLVHPSTGGVGLCNEYLCPSLCNEVQPGEKFVKFGIGLFTRPDWKDYCFYHKYDITPFKTKWEIGRNSAIFYTEPDHSKQDSLKQIKKIMVSGQELSMEVEIENTGHREIAMEEFCHNFLSIDGLKIGPSYRLDIPYLDRTDTLTAGTLYGQDGSFSFTGYNEKAALLQIGGEHIKKGQEEYAWTLSHEESAASIKCIDGFCPAHLDIWTIDHIISVETFYPIELRPGEKVNWRRKWIFNQEE